MITPDCIYICFYLENVDSPNRLFTLNLTHIKRRDKLLTSRKKVFFQLFPDLSAIVILTHGVVYYWKDALIDVHVEYQIPFVSIKEYITFVECMNNNIMIGSSTGEIYLLELKNHGLNTYMFYTHHSSISYFMSLFSQTQQFDGLTTMEKQNSTDAIVSMCSIGETLYILTSRCIQVWRISTNNEVEVKEFHFMQKKKKKNKF